MRPHLHFECPRCISDSAPKTKNFATCSKGVRWDRGVGITSALWGRRASGTDLFVRGGGSTPRGPGGRRAAPNLHARRHLQAEFRASGHLQCCLTHQIRRTRPTNATGHHIWLVAIVLWPVSSCNCCLTSEYPNIVYIRNSLRTEFTCIQIIQNF